MPPAGWPRHRQPHSRLVGVTDREALGWRSLSRAGQDADRDLFSAELSLSQIQLSEVLTVVQLNKALGGGWQ